MERLRRLSARAREAAPTGARLLLASALNFLLSAVLFDPRNVDVVDVVSFPSSPTFSQLFRHSPAASFAVFTFEGSRLPKMRDLWPAHSHPFFYIGYCFMLYILMRYVSFSERSPRDEMSMPNGGSWLGKKRNPLLERVLLSLPLSLLLSVTILPMLRIGEFHVVVILFDILHVFLSSAIVAVCMFAPLPYPPQPASNCRD